MKDMNKLCTVYSSMIFKHLRHKFTVTCTDPKCYNQRILTITNIHKRYQSKKHFLFLLCNFSDFANNVGLDKRRIVFYLSYILKMFVQNYFCFPFLNFQQYSLVTSSGTEVLRCAFNFTDIFLCSFQSAIVSTNNFF